MSATARRAALALLQSRSADATVCPSEVARAIAPEGCWRDAMLSVHSAVDQLLAEGAIRLSWKGRPLTAREGPYRIARSNPVSSMRRSIDECATLAVVACTAHLEQNIVIGHLQVEAVSQISLDAYALLILAPETPLGSGWLGGDRVVGRAAVRDLLSKARRFQEGERARLTLYLPAIDTTLGWEDFPSLGS